MAKFLGKKVKRKHVDWYKKLYSLHNDHMIVEFLRFKKAHKTMSDNRCAYNVVKRHYSPTTMTYIMLTDAELRDPYGLDEYL